MKINKTFTVILIVFIILVLSVYITNAYLVQKDNKKVIQLSIKKCNAQLNKCKVNIDDFEIGIDIDRNIEYLKTFNMKLWVENKKNNFIESIYIDFKMNGMDMGVNRFKLIRNEPIKFSKTQSWHGKVVLPICVTGKVDWLAKIELISQKKQYEILVPIKINLLADR